MLTGFFSETRDMHACQMHAFQDTEKKNDMSLQARVLHAFLSAAKFSKVLLFSEYLYEHDTQLI